MLPRSDVLYAAPTALPPLRVRNCEIPHSVLPFLDLHKMRKEAVHKLDLAKHDVIHVDLVDGGDGLVGGLVV